MSKARDNGTVKFPREDDGLGWAWGLAGKKPEEVWERFSPAYEAQAEEILQALQGLGYVAQLDWAGSEDGEAALAYKDGQLRLVVHLEDPVDAGLLQNVRAAGTLPAHLRALL